MGNERVLQVIDKNVVHTSHARSRVKYKDNLKTYIYRQNTTLLEVLKIKVQYYITSNIEQKAKKQTTIPLIN